MSHHRICPAALALAFVLAIFVGVASPAAAAINHEALFRFGLSPGSEPGRAGVLTSSEGIVAATNNGRIYVGGIGSNNRIDEFSPWGEFITAFGWDVAPGPVNEVQELRVRASAGTFKLTFGAATTSPLPFDASGIEVEGALDALSTIGGAGGSVSVSERVGTPDGTIPYVYAITLEGTLGSSDQPQLTTTNELSGGKPSTILETDTRADGTLGGTGFEHCTADSGCKAGQEGGGSGQMKVVFGLAIDSSNDIYVRDAENRRVQEFSPEGRFVLMFGGDVNKTKVEEGAPEAQRNLCTAASGNECQAGIAGTGKGQFADGFGLAVIGGTVYVGDKERIQKFTTGGEYLGDLADPEGVLNERTVRWMAADAARGRLYVVLAQSVNQPKVHVLDATTGQQIAERQILRPANLVVDEAGNLFALEKAGQGAEGKRPEHVVELDADGKQLVPDQGEEEQCASVGVNGTCALFAAPEAGFVISELALGTSSVGDLFVSNAGSHQAEEFRFVQAYGPPPLSLESPPSAPPSIDSQYAATVTDTEAEVKAQINPHFFAGALGPTTYFVQYGTAACIEAGGWEAACVSEKSAPPGAILKAGVVDEDVDGSVLLSGLAPRTAYRYRFIAEGNGKPGVQIVGVGGEEGVEGADAGFRTHAAPAEEAQPPCPGNEAFRTGAAAALPDCRAYEMVSPVDKEGGEVRVLSEARTALPAVVSQSAVSGDALTYGSYRAFAGAESSLYTTQYIATRGAGGWSSRAISPPQTTQIVATLGTFDNVYKFFGADLCEGWLGTFGDPPLASGAVAGYPNLYRRQLCPAGGEYEALTQVKPEGAQGPFYELELQGLSSDGGTAIYTATGKLPGTSAPKPKGGDPLLYAYKRGEATPRFVCILPGGAASTQPCSAGGPVRASAKQRVVRVNNAISEDGTRIFWTAGDKAIYLRENPFAEVPECSGEGSPCTLAVSRKGEELSGAKGAGAQFWGAAKDGSKAIFTVTEGAKGIADLYEFDVSGNAVSKVAGKVAGVAGMSEDAARIYLVSSEDLDGAGPAKAGQPNLYLRDGGKGGANMRFIATLASADLRSVGGGSSVAAFEPALRATQVSGDGEEAAFMSFASLSGYDNHDLASGQPDKEVYLYRAAAGGGAGKLICASCNPTGTRPSGANLSREAAPFWVAAQIPVAENNLHEARVITDGGRRLFFETTDPLALRDTNGAKDVYQWEEAGTGSCVEEAASFVAAAEGCVSLISSGKSRVASEFLEASPDGKNVFLTTLSSLVPQDPGVTDVYDAREDGGLPPLQPPPAACEGEACQGPYSPPNDPTPASASFEGAGNVKEAKAKKKHRKKHKRHAKHAKRRAHR